MTPYSARIDKAVDAARGDPRRTVLIARLAQKASRRSLTLQKLFGANPRTLLLGASMALGSPHYFFLAEAVALNLLLIGSVRHHNAAGRRLAEKLG